MTACSTHLVLLPGLVCTEDLFAEQIADSDDVGHLLRFEAGRRSDLMSATLSNVTEGRNG